MSSPRKNLDLSVGETAESSFPEMNSGHSFAGKLSPSMQFKKDILPVGYKEMIIFNQDLKQLGIAIVPENTPELTQEELEQYNSLNPM